MQAAFFSILGDRNTIEELRAALVEEPNAKQLIITEPSEQGSLASAPSDRVRQIDAAEALFAFAIHIPAGVTAHFLYDWLKNWLKSRAGDARVTEHPSVPNDKSTTSSPPLENSTD
jgi:hypothetical protein